VCHLWAVIWPSSQTGGNITHWEEWSSWARYFWAPWLGWYHQVSVAYWCLAVGSLHWQIWHHDFHHDTVLNPMPTTRCMAPTIWHLLLLALASAQHNTHGISAITNLYSTSCSSDHEPLYSTKILPYSTSHAPLHCPPVMPTKPTTGVSIFQFCLSDKSPLPYTSAITMIQKQFCLSLPAWQQVLFGSLRKLHSANTPMNTIHNQQPIILVSDALVQKMDKAGLPRWLPSQEQTPICRVWG